MTPSQKVQNPLSLKLLTLHLADSSPLPNLIAPSSPLRLSRPAALSPSTLRNAGGSIGGTRRHSCVRVHLPSRRAVFFRRRQNPQNPRHRTPPNPARAGCAPVIRMSAVRALFHPVAMVLARCRLQPRAIRLLQLRLRPIRRPKMRLLLLHPRRPQSFPAPILPALATFLIARTMDHLQGVQVHAPRRQRVHAPRRRRPIASRLLPPWD